MIVAWFRSCRAFQRRIHDEQLVKSQSDAKKVSEDVELERIFLKNEEDNAKVRALREQQIDEEWKKLEEKVLADKSQKETAELEAIQVAEFNVQQHLVSYDTIR
jgi:hypothetical protein